MSEVSSVGPLDIQRILAILPHRYPMLMIDRVVDIVGDERGTGVKNVTFNEPHFQGHFPGNPIMPGVLIVEAMAQTAGVISIVGGGQVGRAQPKAVLFVTIEGCKFRKPVRPGDQLRLAMTKQRARRAISWYRGEATVEGQLVAEATISAMIVDE